MYQLPLSIQINPDTSLENFISGGNEQLLSTLNESLHGNGDPFVYLWGEKDVGKTHLLQACCKQADEAGLTTAYIPLEQHVELAPELLNGLEQLELVCLDDVDRISGMAAWEQAIFNLFNSLRSRGKALIASASCAPAQLDISLADLKSRLSWGISYRIQALTEENKIQALLSAAEARGLQMPEEAAQYVLKRAPRDMGSLLKLLQQLDQASLAAQRRLTIPFIRDQLEKGAG